MLNSRHVDNSPTTNYVLNRWKQNYLYISRVVSQCVVALFFGTTNNREKFYLSPVLSKHKSAIHLENFYKNDFGCLSIELMPTITFTFESNQITSDLAVDLLLHENDCDLPESHWIAPAAIHTANVIVVQWQLRDAGFSNVNKFKNAKDTEACLKCLALKRKVVFISVTKRYVWLVESHMTLPTCDTCKLSRRGVHFPYNQYLRHIPAKNVNKYLIFESTKRMRTMNDDGAQELKLQRAT
uniref:AlNc14C34G3107 protein n=1 Tax=Albugo laibachii Nc14 TaxID=890382 RepID=F0W8I1_9STRA|nr:AlNc14C34G3107 [Albugo laibachii Nc14]CCA26853.1 AlNc14C422G11536 [Albugo laibachii Nc14]|eukprot:CCA26853.1 AlNc14C422G11536 [Albugo laibachii Nc14]